MWVDVGRRGWVGVGGWVGCGCVGAGADDLNAV